MPAISQAGLGAALVGLEALSLARTGRTLGARLARAARRAARRRSRGVGGAPALDAIKSIVMLAHGADAFAGEIAAVGSRHEPSRPDPAAGRRPGGRVAAAHRSCDVDRGRLRRRRRLRRPRPGPGRARHRDRRGRRALDGGAHPQLPPARSLRRDLPRRRHDDGASATRRSRCRWDAPSGGTTVINSGTCYRPPAPVAKAWHEQHGLALADPELLGPRVADVEATIGVAPAPMEVLGRNGELALEGAAALDWKSAAAAPQRARLPRRLPVRDRLPQQRQGRRPPQRPAAGLRGRRADRLRAAA